MNEDGLKRWLSERSRFVILPMNRGLCPKCGAADTLIPIIYGPLDAEQWEAMQRGEIVMGGQPLYDDNRDPTHFCTACETSLRIDNRPLVPDPPHYTC